MKKYLVITNRTEKFNTEYIQPHYDFLNQLKANHQLEMYGPFSDETGGAYIMTEQSLEQATKLASLDPLVLSGSSSIIIKEWLVKQNR
ncbi:YciI family protein [Neobacillus sp. Marseille-QA0830]